MPAPTITSFTPSSGATGTDYVQIIGTNFDPIAANNTVKFNGVMAQVISATTTLLYVIVPFGATTGTISVTTSGGTGTSAGNFTIVTMIKPLQQARSGMFRSNTTRANYYSNANQLTDFQINGKSILPLGILEKKSLKISEQVTTLTNTATFNMIGSTQSIEPNTVGSNITVGTTPKYIVINQITQRAYVTNTGGTVSVIDLTTNTVIATIAGITNANYCEIDTVANRLYVTQTTPTNSVTVIDTLTNAVITTIAGFSSPAGVDIDSANGFIYVANSGTNQVYKVSTSTYTITTKYDVGTNPQNLIYSSIENEIYVANQGSNNVSIINPVTSVIVTITVGTAPIGIEINTRLNKLYVVNNTSNTVSVIDGTSNTVQATIALTTTNAQQCIFDDYTHRLYVTDGTGPSTIHVVDLLTNTEIGTIAAGTTGAGIDCNLSNHTVYMADNTGNRVVPVTTFSQVSVSPELGSTVNIYVGGSLFWGGIVTKRKLVRLQHGDPTNTAIRFRVMVTCEDYTRLLKKRVLQSAGGGIKEYYNFYAGDIIKDIISQVGIIGDGFTQGNIQQGPLLSYMSFDHRNALEAMKQVADTVYYNFNVTPDRKVNFFNPVNVLPQYTIQAGSTNYDKFEFEEDASQVRNRIYVRGAKNLSAVTTRSFAGDGTNKIFSLGNDPANVSVTVGGVAKTIGILNIDTGKDFYVDYNRGEASAAVAPGAGVAVVFTLQNYIPTIKRAQNSNTGYGSQVRIGSLEGGDGVYEVFIEDTTLTTLQSAVDRAQGELLQFGKPTLRGSFESWNAKFNIGDYLQITLNDRKFNTIVQVTKRNTSINRLNGFMWQYEFTSTLRDKYIKLLQKFVTYTQPHNQFGGNVVNEVLDPTDTEITIT